MVPPINYAITGLVTELMEHPVAKVSVITQDFQVVEKIYQIHYVVHAQRIIIVVPLKMV